MRKAIIFFCAMAAVVGATTVAGAQLKSVELFAEHFKLETEVELPNELAEELVIEAGPVAPLDERMVGEYAPLPYDD